MRGYEIELTTVHYTLHACNETVWQSLCCRQQKQDAKLSQRDRATHCVSWNIINRCCTAA